MSAVSWGNESDNEIESVYEEEQELGDGSGFFISQHDPTQESIGAGEPAGAPGGDSDSSGDAQGERLEAPLSQIPPNLEFEEFAPEEAAPEPGSLPRSESQDQWSEDDSDSEYGWEDDDDDAGTEKSQGVGDATLLSVEETVRDILGSGVLEAFEPMLAAGGPSRPSKRQRSNPALHAGVRAAYTHDCAAQRALRAARGPEVNVACDVEYHTSSRRGHVLKLFCTACKCPMVELRVGNVLRVNGNLTLVRSLGPRNKTLHLQKLSESLRMHTGTRCAGPRAPIDLPLLKMGGARGPVFMLTREHLHVTVEGLNTAWTNGMVEWLPPSSAAASVILFCRSATTNDVESVDFDTAPTNPCGCFFPWATPKGPDLRPGDLVEIVPAGEAARRRRGEPALDQLTRLGRFQGWPVEVTGEDKENERPSGGTGGSGSVGTGSVRFASQPSAGRRGKPGTAVAVRLLDLQMGEKGSTTYTFRAGNIRRMPRRYILRRLDPAFDLPHGVTLDEDDAQGAPSPGSGEVPPPLVCVELFAGMGGLSLGLEASGAAVVRWAVDACRPAIDTYRGCHPEARAFCDDVCRFLEKLGTPGYPARWERGAEAAAGPDAPLTLLVGGPPCQGFSGASKADPQTRLEKNICLAVFLEAVARLMPAYLIIENVKGMLRAAGAVEGVFQVLVSLGYQVRLRVLNAGAYGVAQHRVRTIIMAARHGLPLPQAPCPTHVFNAGGYDPDEQFGPCNLAKRTKCALAGVPLRWRACVRVLNCAFLPRLRVWDVLWDLTSKEGEGAGYKCPPQCPFQAAMRAGVAPDAPLVNHVTNVRGLRAETRERLDAVPREADAAGPGRIMGCADPHRPPISGDFRDVPFYLLPPELQDDQARDIPRNWGRIGRLFWWSHFRTLLTKACVAVNSKTAGPVLHPLAARPLTVREAARVQGIPDRVVIHGGLADGYKQCGNGVPPQLAAALGRELRRVEVLRWRRQQG